MSVSDASVHAGERLRRLLDDVRPAGRAPWTVAETAAATGVPAGTIRALCAGTGTAGEGQFAALAAHFLVPAEHLTGDGPEHRARERVARRLRRLFRDIYPAWRGPWSPEEMAGVCGVPVEDLRRMLAGAPPAGGGFAARLDQLCRRTSPATGRPWSNREVGTAIGRSGQYIGNLRAGVNEPGLPVATGLSRLFEVSVAYFADGPCELLAGHFRVTEAYLTDPGDSAEVHRVEASLCRMIAVRRELEPCGHDPLEDTG